MNYKPFVGFGFYGAANATQRANFYSSWGLLGDVASPSPGQWLAFVLDDDHIMNLYL